MQSFKMDNNAFTAFAKAKRLAAQWATGHQLEIGVAEMALGAAIIAWGVQHGALEIGCDLLATALLPSGDISIGAKVGAALGATVGAMGGSILGSVGMVAMGGAIGIPAILVFGGSAALLAAAGYTVGDLIDKQLNPPVDFGDFILGGGGLLMLGTGLLIDGARRLVKDARFLATASAVKDGVIYLAQVTTAVVARSAHELAELARKSPNALAGVACAAALGAPLYMAGSAAAASSVTLLGSSSLGSAALALGLVSAPIWPAIALGSAGAAVGYAVWRTLRRGRSTDRPDAIAKLLITANS